MSDFIELDLDDLGLDNAFPKQKEYQYYKNLANRTIIINEDISSDIIDSATIPFINMDNDGSLEPITIYVNTNGGEIYSGYSLVDAIECAKSPVKIKILGMAASMGTLIVMAGKNNPNVKSVCSKFSVGLLHSGSAYLEGSSHSVKDTFNFSQAYEDKIKDYIISHSNIDEDFYEKIERKEFWMDADEMLRLGIVDEIE